MKRAPEKTKVKLAPGVLDAIGPNGLEYVVALALEKTGGEPCRRVHGFPVGRQCKWAKHHLFYYVEQIQGMTCVAIKFYNSERVVPILEDK